MPELGRAALVVCLGWRSTPWSRASTRRSPAAAGSRARPRTRCSPRSARRRWPRASCSRRSSATTSRSSTSPTTRACELPTPYTISAFWGGQEGSLLLWLLVLTGFSAAAVAFAAAPARICSPGSCRCSASSTTFFAFMLVAVSSPFATQVAPADGAGLNPSLQNPYMMIHPPMPLPRLRRPDDPVRLRDGRAARAAHRRALDRRHAPLDALRLDRARDRPAPRLPLGLRRGRLGRLLRLGPGRERGAHAVARRDRVPALGDDPGEARHAEGLEHAARHPRVLSRALRDVPHAVGRRQLDPLVHRRARSAPWFLGFICLITVGSLALLVSRLPLLRSQTRMESLVSREATFLYNNLLLVALCLTILWGVDVPDPVRGRARASRSRSARPTTTSSCGSSGCRCSC